MIDAFEAMRLELTSQEAHWRSASIGLADLDNFAAPDAWRSLDAYLGTAVRRHLQSAVNSAVLELDAIAADLRSARSIPDLTRVRVRMNGFRRRYLQIETVVEFFGHAVRSRTTTRLAELLRALDILAMDAMVPALRPLKIDVPPVLVYVDRGLGASILRANLRLWDGGSPSPAAAVKITRFNLYRPTSMLHEVGHQAAHLTGWNTELARALRDGIPDPLVADAFAGWATELGPDLFAFAHAGYGSVAALHDVVAGDSRAVFNFPLGDPHPIAYLRVLAGIEMCIRFYGTGPWDRLRQAWMAVHPLSAAPPEVARLVTACLAQLPRVVDIGLRRPMRAFGGLALSDVVDPGRVSPAALAALQKDAGTALTTSAHYLSTEGLRLLAASALEIATQPERAADITRDYEAWMRRLGTVGSARVVKAA